MTTRQRAFWFLVLVQMALAACQTLDIIIEYTTNGEVKLNIMNITFHTTELHVTLLGCDYAYYDNYLIVPPMPTWKTQVTPFHCLECQCVDFESERIESFVSA